MSESTDIVRQEAAQPLGDDEYKELRGYIIDKCESIAGGTDNPQAHHASMAFLDCLERAVRAAAAFAAKDGPTARTAFSVGLREFLQ